ncbi:YdhK family protein [Halalkalibacter alkalisediminis]|uniref:YdhK family protein n=1 Tax=Halalkalibacter alkalisediminis TaxID=935616 RepID=A0ABV6NGE1_9BACI|nr:YdhK family protein [Halalkalibacter alkalisediminis]
MKRLFIGLVFLLAVLALGACASGNDNVSHGDHGSTEETPEDIHTETEHDDDHSHMDHSSSGKVPEDLKVEENATYSVGSKAIIKHGHMSGMEGAKATIVGAYQTRVYAVSYDPTTGGEREINHKWVIHEELADVGEGTLEVGSEVVLAADHMAGMEGALAIVDSVEETTVYMVDFTLTTGGEEIKNHKWVTEDELGPLEHR